MFGFVRSEILLNFCRSQEEIKKLKQSIPSGNEFGDCIFIDEEEEEENEATLEQPMPMLLEEPCIESDLMVISLLIKFLNIFFF